MKRLVIAGSLLVALIVGAGVGAVMVTSQHPNGVLHGSTVIPGFVSQDAITYAYKQGSVVKPRMQTWIEAPDNYYPALIQQYGLVRLYGGTPVRVIEHASCPTTTGSFPSVRHFNMDIVRIRLPDNNEAWVSGGYVIER